MHRCNYLPIDIQTPGQHTSHHGSPVDDEERGDTVGDTLLLEEGDLIRRDDRSEYESQKAAGLGLGLGCVLGVRVRARVE